VLEDRLAVVSCAATLLGAERLCYVWIARAPERFRAVCAGPLMSMAEDPITAVAWLFYGFKVLQFSVFVWWCCVFGQGLPAPDLDLSAAATGILALVVGQTLNLSVFYRLGRTGVFYGAQFGYSVNWTDAFPFSVFKHPQYVGTVLSIWGFFLIARYPQGDWWLLPAIETIYYAIGARLEDGAVRE
jgi:phosphatidyl-N-methylethanolamine N-methyltransferase